MSRNSDPADTELLSTVRLDHALSFPKGESAGAILDCVALLVTDDMTVHSQGDSCVGVPQLSLESRPSLTRIQKYDLVPVRFEIELNAKNVREIKYATLAHELAQLYCGHLGAPDERWWPNRTILSEEV